MDTFGNTTVEGATGQLSNNILGTGFPATKNGEIESISAYLNPTGGARLVKFAMYDTSDNLIAQTVEITASSGAGWYTAPFATPVPVTNGVTYRLLAWANGSFQCTIARTSQTGVGRLRAMTYGASFPDPGGTSANNFRYSIYATYYSEPPVSEGEVKIKTDGLFESYPVKVKSGGAFHGAVIKTKDSGIWT